MMQKTNPECINVTESILLAAVCQTAASKIDSVTSMGSANCGRKVEGRNRKPYFSTQYSMLGDGELGNFTCDSCQETFLSKYALLKHVFVHIDSVKPPLYICRLCGEVFPTQRSLQIHSKMKENQCIVAKKGSSNKRENYRKLRSMQCSRNTSEHRQENVSLGSDDGSFRQTGKDIPQPEHSDGDSYQTCISKDVTLSKLKHSKTGQRPRAAHRSNTSLMPSAHLKQHDLVHSVDMLYMCSDCGRCFKYKVHLMQHAVSHRKKSFVCDDCGRTFKRPVDLRQHTWSHTGEKPHKCKCGKAFAKSGSLKRHEMVHRGERPFRCDMCFKTFTDACVLKNHALVHTGKRAHVCDKCGKAFKEVGHLRRHTLLHTGEKPYVCRICRKSFTQSGSLKRHTRVHTGEKPYKCGVCSKSFADCSNWRVHFLKYHREETHKCDICEKHFVKRHSLLQHVRVHIL